MGLHRTGLRISDADCRILRQRILIEPGSLSQKRVTLKSGRTRTGWSNICSVACGFPYQD